MHTGFLKSFALICAAMVAGYVALYFAVIPAPLVAENWLRNTLIAKQWLADRAKGPRILLFGGSSTLFSISAKLLSESLQQPAINMGLHANFPLAYHLDLARRTMRSSDTVIILPEYGYYTATGKISSWLVRQIMAWDSDYFERVSFTQKLKVIFSTPFKLVIDATFAQLLHDRVLKHYPERARLTTDQVASDLVIEAKKNETPDRKRFGYSYRNLNLNGDFENAIGTDPEVVPRGGIDIAGEFPKGAEAWSELSAFFAECKTSGVRCYLGLPPLVNPILASDKAKLNSIMSGLVQHAARAGIPLIDAPSDVIFELPMFFDTRLHLNVEGRRLRTETLARKLSELR